MNWPSAVDYSVAVRQPARCFADPDLARSRPLPGLFGAPLSYSGNFASVFKLEAGDRFWAVKCFTRRVSGLRQRYDAISRHLSAYPRKFTVGFQYVAEGIRVGNDWYPIVKMDWVEGYRLNEVVEKYAADRAFLDKMGQLWLRLAAELRDANMAHGDLQHGNVLLVEGSKAATMALRLIDYDGMWVPALADRPPDEVGQPNYQHPARRGGDGYAREVDHFSHLVIYTALRCLAVGGSGLWDRHAQGESLLFREADFKEPASSRLLPELLALPDPQTTNLVSWLVLASQGSIQQVPFLPDLMSSGQVRSLTTQQQAHVRRLLGGRAITFPKPVTPALPVPPRFVPPPQPLVERPPGSGRFLLIAAGAIVAAGLFVALGFGLALWVMRDRPQHASAPPDNAVTPVRDKEDSKPPQRDEKKDDRKDVPGGGDRKGEGNKSVKLPPVQPRVEMGHYFGGLKGQPTALVARRAGARQWQKVAKGDVVHTADTLVALPGFASTVRTRTGVGLLLRGQLSGYLVHPMPELIAESAVVLHKNDKVDLDLTLLRGRVFLTNRKDKGPATIRLQFDQEVWNLTLYDVGGEVGIDLMRAYSAGINYRVGDPPHTRLYLWLFQGECEVKVDAFHSYTMETEDRKSMWMSWSSLAAKHTPPIRVDSVPQTWSKLPLVAALPQAQRGTFPMVGAALKGLESQLNTARIVEVPIKENVSSADATVPTRVIAISCLGALDITDNLIDALGDENPEHQADRVAALFALRRWLSRSAAQGKELYDEKTKSGTLVEKFKPADAQRVYTLLHDFEQEAKDRPPTFEALARGLEHPRVAVAELSWFQLIQLSQGVKLPGPPYFNAAWRREDRQTYARRIEDMISKKQLPKRE